MPPDAPNSDADGPPAAPEKSEEIVVILTRRGGQCAECQREILSGDMIRMEAGKPLCLACADLDHLEFLTRGNTALTRRASRHSPLRAVVIQWSRSRRRFERQGILATTEAIDRAETECESDASVRARRREVAARSRDQQETEYVDAMAGAIRRQFPGCPEGEAARIASWTCRKYSGRVGRTAAAKDLEAEPLRLAVLAHVRHEHTDYDRILAKGGDRQLARHQVRAQVAQTLEKWQSTAERADPAARR
jgi:hypothetical protein